VDFTPLISIVINNISKGTAFRGNTSYYTTYRSLWSVQPFFFHNSTFYTIPKILCFSISFNRPGIPQKCPFLWGIWFSILVPCALPSQHR